MIVETIYAGHSADWWTPPEWMDWAERTLVPNGGALFDPCPRDWDPERGSGLDVPWQSPCYVNHPGTRHRGAAAKWWRKYQAEQERYQGGLDLVWCAFSVEQLRHMVPSPFHLPGWLVMPRKRIGFVWGGPDGPERRHGGVASCPGNWTVFWTTRAPATPPTEAVIVRTA